MRETFFNGYVELYGGEGIVQISIYPPSNGYVAVYVQGNHADDVDSKEELEGSYGEYFYTSLDDFRAGNTLGIEDVWPDEAL